MANLWRWLAVESPASAQSGSVSLVKTRCESGPLSIETVDVRRLVTFFIGFGLLARAIRFYLCFPLWDDESFLCVNLIHRTYAELLQPLDYHQVAPVLFLWFERALVNLLGFSEYSLRLLPFVCSIISLFLFRRIAERLLTGPALVFAVAIFAVSYPGIRYAAEAKPYGTDMFVSLVMLWLVVEWNAQRGTGRLALLAALMPVALGMSYPAVFTAGGLSLVVASVLFLKQGTLREWITWSVWNLSLIASFGVWFHLVGRIQGGAEGEFMGEYWKLSFPPVNQPWLVPYWVLKTHASDFLAYPVGGPKWASTGTLILCMAGLWQWAQQRRVLWLGLALCPAGLHFVAAALQKYPYGGHVKFSQYLAPMICCLAAAGAAQVLSWSATGGLFGRSPDRPQELDESSKSSSRGAGFQPVIPQWQAGSLPHVKKHSHVFSLGGRLGIGIAVCVAIGCGSIVRDLANPYKTRSDFRARAFAQAFWPGTSLAEEVVCMKSDLGLDFVPDEHRELSWSAHYYCNRAIEIARSSLRPGNFDRVSADRPLRCVLYHDARYAIDQARLNDWLTQMRANFDLVAHESLPFPRMAKDDRRLITMEYIHSYKFVPRGTLSEPSPPMAEAFKPSPR